MSAMLLSILAAGASAAPSQLLVDAIFADHMVVQQGKSIPVRGSAPPGTSVSVAFNGTTAVARADKQGRWVARLAKQRSGTIGSLTVTAASGERVQFGDVAVGEVWLCSGQSNMDLTVRQASNPDRTAREAGGQPIRVMKVRRTASASAASTFTPETPWSAASAASVADFSAVCWQMARSMRTQGIDVPIGLIHAAWGGSTIEDWMSPDALRAAGVADQALETLREYAVNPRSAVARAITRTDQWASANDPGSAPASAWFRDDWNDGDWETVEVPGQWERSGIKALASYDGVMWLRRGFQLTAEQAAAGASLNLGRIDERERVWINGRSVGASLSADVERNYILPAGVLKAGANTIAVRIVDEMGGGGFSSSAATMAIELSTGTRIPLAGSWRYRPGVADDAWREAPPFISWAAPRGLAMAWNGMIAPLHDFPLAGIAWYQGESNTSRVQSYGKLLDAWRAQWRRQFGDATLPVVIVQLPGYGPRTARPANNNWAQLREVQRQVSLADAHTGLAVTIDLGVSSDIHPAHKDIAGQRIAGEAMRVAYGKAIPVAPSPVSAERAPAGVVVRFAGAADGLVTYGALAPTAFEWCSAARICEFANAMVASGSIIVAAPDGAAFIRYAWQGFPQVNLYSSNGLPVVPFEISVR